MATEETFTLFHLHDSAWQMANEAARGGVPFSIDTAVSALSSEFPEHDREVIAEAVTTASLSIVMGIVLS